jgi:hypothetical protein
MKLPSPSDYSVHCKKKNINPDDDHYMRILNFKFRKSVERGVRTLIKQRTKILKSSQ